MAFIRVPGGRGTPWGFALGWLRNRGAPSPGWVLLVEEINVVFLCPKQPKGAKSPDKEGSEPVNVAFLRREMR